MDHPEKNVLAKPPAFTLSRTEQLLALQCEQLNYLAMLLGVRNDAGDSPLEGFSQKLAEITR